MVAVQAAALVEAETAEAPEAAEAEVETAVEATNRL